MKSTMLVSPISGRRNQLNRTMTIFSKDSAKFYDNGEWTRETTTNGALIDGWILIGNLISSVHWSYLLIHRGHWNHRRRTMSHHQATFSSRRMKKGSHQDMSSLIRLFRKPIVVHDEPMPYFAISSTLSPDAPIYDASPSSRCTFQSSTPEDDADILLSNVSDDNDCADVERYLTDEIEHPIKLLTCKEISSRVKNTSRYWLRGALVVHVMMWTSFRLSDHEQDLIYYCPLENWTTILQLLRWQHGASNVMTPLLVYANARDAHEATEFNVEKNYFCLLRLQLRHSHGTEQTSLHLAQPSNMHFDRMWIYSYDGWTNLGRIQQELDISPNETSTTSYFHLHLK